MKLRLMPHQFAAIYSPYTHTAMFGGVGCGKSFTGSQFSVRMICEHPELTGLVAANTYDQLSQATLRELFYWLEAYGFEFVVDQRPPAAWGPQRRTFKSYQNVLSVRQGSETTSILTRVLSKGDALRGIELSWAWLDETRDTPRNTHDVILSRLRESNVIRTLITTTTNGRDWCWERFVKNGNDESRLYGSMHVPTIAAVRAGVIPQAYYDQLVRSYSHLVAQQELHAMHVNVLGGRAYYAAGDWNERAIAPWGDAYPNKDRPLLVGCDFNFAPAPMVWQLCQTGPYGTEWEDHVHVFGELAESGIGSAAMAKRLAAQWPDFPLYQVYGDASGNRASTSNAGEHDFYQISQALSEEGCMVSVDADQANPHVRDRLENVNARLKNAADEVHVTYNPERCPLLHIDLQEVGVKPNGKLDDGGDVQRTHASDGLGYLLWKVLPPPMRGVIVGAGVGSIASEVNESI